MNTTSVGRWSVVGWSVVVGWLVGGLVVGEFNKTRFYNIEQSSEILIFKIEMLLEFQNKTDIKIIGF